MIDIKKTIKDFCMSDFTNVTVTKKANIYFNGNVTSRTIELPNGSRKSLGIMLPGEYEFGTSEKEIMEIIAGVLEVMLPETDKWKLFKAGDQFEVKQNSKFKLKVKTITDYCCSYVK